MTKPRRIHVANPSDRSMLRRPGCRYGWRAYLLAFGAYGDTYVLAYGSDLDSALETAAEWLAEHAPGHVMAHDSAECQELWREACAAEGIDPDDPDADGDAKGRAFEAATADLTYTEAGYLTSHEWTIVSEDIGPAELRAFARGK